MRRSGIGLALVLLAWAAGVGAQGTQTGVLAGVVVDAGGTPLPAVEVTVAGARVERRGLTDEAGRFRFPALPLGAYRVRADLLGLEARGAASVFAGKITEVSLRLGEAPTREPGEDGAASAGAEAREGVAGRETERREAAEREAAGETGLDVAERIQVVAVAPLIDLYDTRAGATVRRELLDQLPVERFYQSVALLLPGVAGGEDGNPAVSGALRSANLYLIDGVDTTDPTTGLFGLNLAYEALEAVDVTTAAADVSHGRASGAVINAVTRSGSDEFEGSLRWLATSDAWDSDYRLDDQTRHLRPEIEAANASDDEIDPTLALTLGGPLLPGRAWFFGAFEDADDTFLRPTRQGPRWNGGVAQRGAAFKLSAQPSSRLSLVAQHTRDSADFAEFTPFDRGPGENRAGRQPSRLGSSIVIPIPGDVFALDESEQRGQFSKLEASFALSQNASFELIVARQERELERGALNSRGVTADAPHVAVTQVVPPSGPDDDFDIREIALFNGVTDRGLEQRPREQGNLSLALYAPTGKLEHELSAGLDVQRTRSRQRLAYGGRSGVDRALGVPVDGQLFIDLDTRPACLLGNECEAFDASDGSFRPFLLFNFWRRPAIETTSRSWALYASDALRAGRWLLRVGLRAGRVEAEDAAGRTLVDADTLSPRLALNYDPTGDGKTLLGASWGRYHEPFLHGYLDAFGRFDVFSGHTEYTWAGVLGFDCRGEDPADLDSRCWIPTDLVGLVPSQPAPPAPELEPASVDEWTASFERQLSANVALELRYVGRRWRDLWDNVLRPDASVPGGVGSRLRTLPRAERSYQGVQLLVQRRFADRWQLLGSYTWSRSRGNLFSDDGLDTFADFAPLTDLNLVNRLGPAPFDRRHRGRLFANYRLPLAPARSPRLALSLGSALAYDSGTPYQPEAEEALGVRFLSPRGELRGPDLLRWDVSARLEAPLGAFDWRLELEVFNLTDEQGARRLESRLGGGRFGLAPSIVDLETPRSVRLTLGLSF